MDSKFKAGDRVVADGLGFGTIQGASIASMNPLQIRFDSGYELRFREDGKLTGNDPRPTIHLCNTGDVTFSTADIPDLPVDTLIWVALNVGDEWIPRYLKEFNDVGKAVCWWNGATSVTAAERFIEWSYYRFTDPSEDGKS